MKKLRNILLILVLVICPIACQTTSSQGRFRTSAATYDILKVNAATRESEQTGPIIFTNAVDLTTNKLNLVHGTNYEQTLIVTNITGTGVSRTGSNVFDIAGGVGGGETSVRTNFDTSATSCWVTLPPISTSSPTNWYIDKWSESNSLYVIDGATTVTVNGITFVVCIPIPARNYYVKGKQ